MIPTLSSSPVPTGWAERVNHRSNTLVDYENGAAVLDLASSNNSFSWKAETDGTEVLVSRDGVSPVSVVTGASITEVSLAFDPTMRTHVAFVDTGSAYWKYWDTLSGDYQVMSLVGARNPRCCSDEKHPILSANRDIVLTYLRGTGLYVRLARDRYTVEYSLVPNPANHDPITETTQLVTFGISTGRRLQWRLV